MGNIVSGQLFHHPMLTIFIAHSIYFDNGNGSGYENNANADKSIEAGDIKDGKQDKQSEKAAAQIPDVLCF